MRTLCTACVLRKPGNLGKASGLHLFCFTTPVQVLVTFVGTPVRRSLQIGEEHDALLTNHRASLISELDY